MSRLPSTAIVPHITLLPTLALWAPVFAGYHTYLSLGAGFARGNTKKYLGTAGVDENSDQLKANRAHGNFTENVPLALILAGVCELNGASRAVLNGVLGFLFCARVAHADFGIKMKGHVEQLTAKGYQWGRLTG